MRNKNAFIILIAVILTLMVSAVTVSAEASDDMDRNSVMGASVEHDDTTMTMLSTSKKTFPKSKFGHKAFGIDVSKWQGDIDWAKAKKAGLKYAIIRVGYGSNFKDFDDPRCAEYVRGCEENGIPYGFYIYSHATTLKKVNSEVAHVKRMIKGTNPTYPVYIDLEDKTIQRKGGKFIAKAALKYCKAIEKAGYVPGVYASLSWWNDYLTLPELDNYEKWIAQWNKSGCTYDGDYGMWQCADNGKIDGISEYIDIDLDYKGYYRNTPGHWYKNKNGKTRFVRLVNGSKYKTENGNKVLNTAKSRWITYGLKKYYLDAYGNKSKGFKTIDNKRYYFGKKGYLYQKRWFTSKGKRYRAAKDGHLLKDGIKTIEGYKYGFNAKGVMLRGKHKLGNKVYYFAKNGKCIIKKCKVKKATAKYRTGPGKKYRIKGTSKKDTVVYIVKSSGKWSVNSAGKWYRTSDLRTVKKYPYTIKKAATSTTTPSTSATKSTSESSTEEIADSNSDEDVDQGDAENQGDADNKEDAESEDTAVLDGEIIEGLTQEELDAQSVMGTSFEEEMEAYQEEAGITLLSAEPWSKRDDGKFYNGLGLKILNGALYKGIDVSKHQKTIDWTKVKNNDVSFAIIRLGFGSDYKSQDDEQLAYNVEQCEKNNIPYGFYLYSYANTKAKNKSEIAHVKRLLKGTNPTYPIYYDLEDRITGKCSNSTIQDYAITFCQEIKKAGYTPGIYSSLYWWRNKLENSTLDQYEKWVAQYYDRATECGYSGKNLGIWQVASDYYCDGISGRVDLNFAYKKYTRKVATAPTQDTSTGSTSETADTFKPGFVIGKDGRKYYYYAKGKTYKSRWVTVGSYKYYAASDGHIYRNTYKKVGKYYYGFSPSGKMYKSCEKTIKGKTYRFQSNGRSRLCTAKTTARINMRSGPGLTYESKGILEEGQKIRIVRKKGQWWRSSMGYWVHRDYLKVIKKYPYTK